MPTYSERKQGIYRCTFLGTVEKDMPNADTGQDEPRWIWKFQEVNDPTTAGQIDKITGTSLRSGNSNAHKIAAGLMGRKLEPNDDTDSRIGQVFDVVYGPNQAGTLTITAVMPVPVAAPAQSPVRPLDTPQTVAEAPTAPLVVDNEVDDHLPF